MTNDGDRREGHAIELHRRAIVIDAACPLITPKRIMEHIPALRRGGLSCAFSTVASIEQARHALEALAAWYARARQLDEVVSLATTAAHIESAKNAGRIAIVLHFQGGAPLEYDSHLVEAFYRLGVRVIQLTYNERNPLGDGCTGARVDVQMPEHVGPVTVSVTILDASGPVAFATHTSVPMSRESQLRLEISHLLHEMVTPGDPETARMALLNPELLGERLTTVNLPLIQDRCARLQSAVAELLKLCTSDGHRRVIPDPRRAWIRERKGARAT